MTERIGWPSLAIDKRIDHLKKQAVQATTGKVWWSDTAWATGSNSTIVAGGKIYTSSIDDQSTIIYSTKDGSLLGSASYPLGVIVVNGSTYYPAASGNVQ